MSEGTAPGGVCQRRRTRIVLVLASVLAVELVALWFLGGSRWVEAAASTAKSHVAAWWVSRRDLRVGARDVWFHATNASADRLTMPPLGHRPVVLVLFGGCSGCTMEALRRWDRFASQHKDLDVWAVRLATSPRSLRRWEAKFPGALKWATASLEDVRPLNVRFVPRVYVFDSTGRLVWLQRDQGGGGEAVRRQVAEVALAKAREVKR